MLRQLNKTSFLLGGLFVGRHVVAFSAAERAYPFARNFASGIYAQWTPKHHLIGTRLARIEMRLDDVRQSRDELRMNVRRGNAMDVDFKLHCERETRINSN